MSPLFRLYQHDFVKGAVVAVLAALATYLAGVLNTPGFDLAEIDWQYILKIATTAFVAYIAKNFVTAGNGKIGGVL